MISTIQSEDGHVCNLFSGEIDDINRMMNISNRQRSNFNTAICGPFRPHQPIIYWIFRNHQMEESSMNKNTKSNQKRTWAVLLPIALSFCSSLRFSSRSLQRKPPKTISESSPKKFLFNILLHVYISAPQRPKSVPKPKKENPPFLFVLFFLFKSTFLSLTL